MANWSKKAITDKLANVYVAMLQKGIVIEKLSVFSIIIKELGISDKYFRKAINKARERITGEIDYGTKTKNTHTRRQRR